MYHLIIKCINKSLIIIKYIPSSIETDHGRWGITDLTQKDKYLYYQMIVIQNSDTELVWIL